MANVASSTLSTVPHSCHSDTRFTRMHIGCRPPRSPHLTFLGARCVVEVLLLDVSSLPPTLVISAHSPLTLLRCCTPALLRLSVYLPSVLQYFRPPSYLPPVPYLPHTSWSQEHPMSLVLNLHVPVESFGTAGKCARGLVAAAASRRSALWWLVRGEAALAFGIEGVA